MKKSELQRIIKEETRKALKEGELTTYLTPEQVKSLQDVVSNTRELLVSIGLANRLNSHPEIQRVLASGTPGLSTLRANLKYISQLKDLKDLKEDTLKEEETAVFKVDDVVVAKVGPMKGVEHKVIAVVSELDGTLKYNIQPIIRPGQRNLYRLGAAAAKASEIFKPQTEPRI